jgi:hypothetical protein
MDLVLMPFALHPANKDTESKTEVKTRLILFIFFTPLFISTYDSQEWVEKNKPDRMNVWKSRQTFQNRSVDTTFSLELLQFLERIDARVYFLHHHLGGPRTQLE